MAKNNKKLDVVIAAGGYGGHVYPALAVWQLLKKDPQIGHIAFVGCPNHLEGEITAQHGIEFHPIDCWEMPREISMDLLLWSGDTAVAVKSCIGYLRELKPDVVLGCGGFPSGPTLIAAALMRIPFLIHDADVFPGLTNRVMAPFAQIVSVTDEEAKGRMRSSRVVLGGTPLRPGFTTVDRQEALKQLSLDPDRRTIMAIGGSRGSPVINKAMAGAARELIEKYNCQVIHQTGRDDHKPTQENLATIWPEHADCEHYHLLPYIGEISPYVAACDLVISRAGAGSNTEFQAYGLPAILVPFALADQDHQTFNARSLERKGAAVCLIEVECNPKSLRDIAVELLTDEERYREMQKNSHALYVPDAAERLAKMVKEVATA